MAQISFMNIDFSYEGNQETVFKNFSVSFDSNWRLGLVARNGRGKTTFLKLIVEQLQPNQGSIHQPHSIVPVMFPPAVDYFSEETAKDIIEKSMPGLEEWRFMRELSLLDVESELLSRPFFTLSPGEQSKILMAALFANEHAYVLLDEPGNHLDVDGKKTLSRYLSGKRSFLLVSHERALLDTVTDHTLAFLKSGPEIVAGPYHIWAEHRKNMESFERAENKRLSKEISKLTESAHQSERWADKAHRDSTKDDGSGVKMGLKEKKRAKSAKLERRAKQTIHQKEQAVEQRTKLLHDVEENESLKMLPIEYHSETLISALNLSLKYPTKTLLERTSFNICRGDRVCLTGNNGAGKSTLLKLIARIAAPEELQIDGSLYMPKGIKVSVLPQICKLPNMSLMNYLQVQNANITRILMLLRKMGFAREVFSCNASELSAGQKRKLMIAISICEEAHLYLWDEPLNYLDIQTREQIEEVLLEAGPTIIFIEHDEYFCKKIATKYISLPK